MEIFPSAPQQSVSPITHWATDRAFICMKATTPMKNNEVFFAMCACLCLRITYNTIYHMQNYINFRNGLFWRVFHLLTLVTAKLSVILIHMWFFWSFISDKHRVMVLSYGMQRHMTMTLHEHHADRSRFSEIYNSLSDISIDKLLSVRKLYSLQYVTLIFRNEFYKILNIKTLIRSWTQLITVLKVWMWCLHICRYPHLLNHEMAINL